MARTVAYDSVSVGIPEQRVPVSPRRAGQIQEERVDASRSAVTNASDVPANVQLVRWFDVTNAGGGLRVVYKNITRGVQILRCTSCVSKL